MDQAQLGDWCTIDILVRVRSSTDAGLDGQTASIRTVSGHVCSVFLIAEDRTVNFKSDALQPIPPNVGDCFKVIMGEDRESVGVVHAIDGNKAFCTINEKNTCKLLKELCLSSINMPGQ